MTPEEKRAATVTGATHAEYLRGKRDQFAMAIPVSLALLGFVIYGLWEFKATPDIILMALPVPLLMLTVYTIAFITTRRRLQKALAGNNNS